MGWTHAVLAVLLVLSSDGAHSQQTAYWREVGDVPVDEKGAGVPLDGELEESTAELTAATDAETATIIISDVRENVETLPVDRIEVENVGGAELATVRDAEDTLEAIDLDEYPERSPAQELLNAFKVVELEDDIDDDVGEGSGAIPATRPNGSLSRGDVYGDGGGGEEEDDESGVPEISALVMKLPPSKKEGGSGVSPDDEETTMPPASVTTLNVHSPSPSTTTIAPTEPPIRSIDSGMRNSKGEKGDPGPQGPPGTCSIDKCSGSPGPIGPPGPKGEQGDPGVPGIGRDGAPGSFAALSDDELHRLASMHGLKGEKGECINTEASTVVDELEPYDSNRRSQYKYQVEPGVKQQGEKGDKGDKGMEGPPGLPGQRTEVPTYVDHQLLTSMPRRNGVIPTFQTSVELFASAEQSPIGSLAFSIANQQLFIRVANGWRNIPLDRFYPVAEHRPSALGNHELKVRDVNYPQREIEDSTNEERTRQTPREAPSTLPPWRRTEDGVNRRPYGYRRTPPDYGGHVPSSPADLPQEHPAYNQYETEFHDHEADRRPPPLVVGADEERRRSDERHYHHPHKNKLIHLVALNEPMSGDLNGVRGADLACYRQARQAGFSTTFRAFISSRVQDLNKIVHYDDRHSTPVVNIHGERLADSWSALFDGSAHLHVPVYSFNGKDIMRDSTWQHDPWVWHGSSRQGLRMAGEFCNAWRSSDPSQYGMASPFGASHSLTYTAVETRCSRRLAVLCVENMSKYNVDRRIGKRIFV